MRMVSPYKSVSVICLRPAKGWLTGTATANGICRKVKALQRFFQSVEGNIPAMMSTSLSLLPSNSGRLFLLSSIGTICSLMSGCAALTASHRLTMGRAGHMSELPSRIACCFPAPRVWAVATACSEICMMRRASR